MNFISENTLVKAVKAGVYAVLFLPLAVLPQIFPFITSKGFLFQIIVEIVFVLYCLLAFKNPAFRPKKTALFYALSFYFAALLLSTVFGAEPERSFFGNFERMWGFFQLAHFFLFFVVVAGVFKGREAWERLVRVAMFAGFLVIAGGVYQFASALLAGQQAPRVSSTIGNPAFLAGYLFFTLIFSLLFPAPSSTKEIPLYKRYSYLALSLLALFIILSTATRGALVALGGALVWLAFLLVFISAKKYIKVAALSFLILVALLAGWLFAYGSLFEKPQKISQEQYYDINRFDAPSMGEEVRVDFLNRLTRFSLYDPTTQTRLITWQSALGGVKEYPLFGIGPENFVLAFNKHFNADFYSYEKYEIWFDRSHNIFMDMLVMGGIVGLLAYLGIFAVCLYSIVSLYRKGKMDKVYFLAFNAFFAMYLIQSFFLFDSFSVFLAFIVAVAYLNSFTGEESKQKEKSVSWHYPRVVFGSLAAVVVAVYFLNVKPMMESYYIAEAESGAYDIDRTIALYQQALSYNTFGDNEARSRMALTVAKTVQGIKEEKLQGNIAGYVDLAIAGLKKNIENTNDYHLLYRLQLSDLYNLKLSRTGMESAQIEDIIRKSIQISPGRMEFEFALAQTEFLKGNFTKAISILEEASRKNPSHPMPYWKISQNYYFWSKAEKDLQKSKALVAQGIPYLEKALYLGQDVRNYQELLWAMEYYNEKLDYSRMVFINKQVLAKNPPDAIAYHMNLALAYQALGKKDKAREHALEVGKLDPAQQPAVDNFLRELQ
ncbi:hypothetical protein A3C91_03790 [Candidatus Azambacteria bacterium RIFCSPHIGHO2_02_FULL_52_12]|uniref:O-antigen ligase-related domain-containing protein n=1 Tax=Candidatus Azambacteria bacterium RIFCSPLOWO2_01_FULL_46_25 TaxID=1797298 RepID=A0A1F5BTU5_9BACT|nr:MAG: hypothetical protein A3C91_03790 [Candidatus Azambacteria bacterium RIFCSPHIGHO2_02_FULL_52_12]OGD34010.1 MAG: hypothetical protein A2988_00805 [Candidatus Azambacteria bacterium RIFCSPLOWO2_01_FULL_46_25]